MAIENGPFSSLIHLLKMMIFHVFLYVYQAEYPKKGMCHDCHGIISDAHRVVATVSSMPWKQRSDITTTIEKPSNINWLYNNGEYIYMCRLVGGFNPSKKICVRYPAWL